MRTVLFFAWAQFDRPERAFWTRLRDALAGRGLKLVLATGDAPPRDLDVDHIRVPRHLDAVWPFGASAFKGVPLDALGLDETALLRRADAWGEPGVVPTVDAQRARALEHLAGFWVSTLAVLRPVLVVIWNGQHVPELVLEAAARRGGASVVFAERAPIARALFIDDQGLSAHSAAAQRPAWTLADPTRSLAIADRVNARIASGGLTWWDQPPPGDAAGLRARLGAGPAQRVLLFAGQVDEDTQQFLFSPHFPGNLPAFRWWLRQLHGRQDVVVLGKHHPKSLVSPDAYRRALAESGVPGAWFDDVSIDDALAACDRVAAVNSTVLYEALARQIPVLVMGKWLVGGRGVAYEVDRLDQASSVVARWLTDADGEAARAAWRHALAYLVEQAIFTYEPAPVTGGARSADELADRLLARADKGREWSAPMALVSACLGRPSDALDPWWMPWDPEWPDRLHHDLSVQAGEWQRWQWLRAAIVAARGAVREGRRLVVWGAGEAGARAAALLGGVGVRAHVFGSSSATPGATCFGRPVVGPDDLRAGGSTTPDFVLVATAAHADVTATLEARGLTRPADFDILRIDDLLAAARLHDDMARPTAAAGSDRRKDNR